MDSYSLKSNDHLLPKKDELPFKMLSKAQIIDGVKLIGGATISTSLSLICVYAINMISLGLLGNFKDDSMMGGIGLGFVCSNCCAYILFTSINQGVNALAAQAHGAKRTADIALNYHRGLLMQAVTIVPILILLGFTEDLLVFFGIDPLVAQYAWEYIKYAYPSFFFYGIFDATKAYLFAQKIFRPILYIQFTSMILHVFWAWLFIVQMGMGTAGAGMAKNIFELFNMTALFIYIHKSGCCDSNWVPFSKVNWRAAVEREGMKKFLSFTLPIAAILFLDMACYEVFSILAGQFDKTQLAVHVAIANSATMYYSLPLGLSIALMTYVSSAMGSGQINAAKNYTYFGIIVDLILTGGFISLLIIFKDPWANLLTASPKAKQLLINVLMIYVGVVFFDGVQVGLSGTLKGIGKQNAATVAMIISYYCVALPLIYWLAFSLGMQVEGIWIGFMVGIIALFGVYLYILKTTDFSAQSRLLANNFGKEKSEVELLKI